MSNTSARSTDVRRNAEDKFNKAKQTTAAAESLQQTRQQAEATKTAGLRQLRLEKEAADRLAADALAAEAAAAAASAKPRKATTTKVAAPKPPKPRVSTQG